MRISVLLLILFLLSSCSSDMATVEETEKIEPAKKIFTIAILPEQNVFEQKKRYKPLAEYLSDKLKMHVKIKLLDSYGSIHSEIINRKIDGAFFGSFNYTLTRARADIIPLARPVTPKGDFNYTGLIITTKGSGVTKDISTWKGKRMALVHRATTAGYIYPKWLLKNNGHNDMSALFSRTTFTGSHDTAILEVFKGRSDIGATKSLIFHRVLKENLMLKDEVLVLYESVKVPSNTLCLRADIKSDLAARIRSILLEMDKDPAGSNALKRLGAINFISTADEDYLPVYRMAEELGINLKEYSFER